MSASGKSSNRLYEYGRGLRGNGHGIYAEEVRRAAEAARRAEAAHLAAQSPMQSSARPRSTSPKDWARILTAAHQRSEHRGRPVSGCPTCHLIWD